MVVPILIPWLQYIPQCIKMQVWRFAKPERKADMQFREILTEL